VYFNTNHYLNDNLEKLNGALQHFTGVLWQTYFRMKKQILDYQSMLLAAAPIQEQQEPLLSH
jgi:hypothetical protein